MHTQTPQRQNHTQHAPAPDKVVHSQKTQNFSLFNLAILSITFWIIFALQPQSAFGQDCAVTGSTVQTPIFSTSHMLVIQWVGMTSTATCNTPLGNSVISCNVATIGASALGCGTPTCVGGRASAISTVMGANCQLNCVVGGNPCTLTINTSDGLPVELMEFGIEVTE